VIAGESVMHRPQAAYQRARTEVPGIRAELWPAATHAVSGQFAAEINTRLLGFVDSLRQ
jgi:hypothetical protein